MKDYDHIVIWLDYFNKTLSRQKGRRLPKEKCIFDPSLSKITFSRIPRSELMLIVFSVLVIGI